MKEIFVTKDNYNNVLKDLFDLQRNGKYAFRGISDDIQLFPTLIRRFTNTKYDHINMNLLSYEKWLLDKYGKHSTQYLPYYHTPLDWVASAQHYGLPTRLIDWSFDPFCALFFSLFCKKEKEDCYKLLVVDLEKHLYFEDVPTFKMDHSRDATSNNYHLENYQIFVNAVAYLNFNFNRDYGHNSRQTQFINKIKEAEKSELEGKKRHLFFCSIYDSNPRIIAQKGLFQIPRVIDIEEPINDILINETYEACDLVYIIKSDIRDILNAQLEKLNINSLSLFPDLQNICEYLKNKTPE